MIIRLQWWNAPALYQEVNRAYQVGWENPNKSNEKVPVSTLHSNYPECESDKNWKKTSLRRNSRKEMHVDLVDWRMSTS